MAAEEPSIEAVIISADQIKETLPGYHPELAGEFHRDSTRLADKQYEEAVRATDFAQVVLLSGGSASGKTEYLSAYLAEESAVVVDGTLPSLKGFQIKKRTAENHSKHVSVHAVIPDDLQRAYSAFLERDRKYDEEHFYRTHADSRQTILEIARGFPDTEIRIVESYIEADGSMSFAVVQFPSREVLIDYLESIQYAEDEIRRYVAAYGEN